jgi:hypothetical protein
LASVLGRIAMDKSWSTRPAGHVAVVQFETRETQAERRRTNAGGNSGMEENGLPLLNGLQ